MIHPTVKFTTLGKGHWLTFVVRFEKFGGKGTSSRRSFRTQADAEEFADSLVPGSRPRIERTETQVVRWEE
jgi:predicted DNA-binding WGR domain protein